MALRGRRGGAPAREDEPRCEEWAEQQAPAPLGPVLPPPPPVDYGVFMQGLVQAMQTLAHTQAALQAQLEAQALSAACRQEGEMEQYFEEKKASQKRPAATFQRQDKKKAVYQAQQRSVVAGSTQVPSIRSPGVKKECPHCRKTHGGSECWMIAGKCLKCGSSDHKIKDCPRLQQGVQCGAPAPAAVAAAAPAIGRPGRPRAPARVFALAREDAEQAEHVTEGTVLLDMGVHARVLFDMGATHSFISEWFARQLALESGIESEDLEVPLSVHTPVGTVTTRKCIPSLPVCIEDRVLEGCFFLLKMKDYDAILGLDSLEEHYALLSLRSSVLDEVIEQQKSDPRLLELVGKAGIARDEDDPEIPGASKPSHWGDVPNGYQAIPSPLRDIPNPFSYKPNPFCSKKTSLGSFARGEETLTLAFACFYPAIWSSSGDLQQLEASWSLEEGFPDSNLLWRSTKDPEEWCFGGFLGLPKESFINLFDPFEGLLEASNPYISSMYESSRIFPRVLDPPNSLVFGARTHSLLRRTGLVGDTPLEETVESDSERRE
ncbi:hypothetical protein Taro_048268 [Colocasia esculenta]|uniref:CCHC-type domain-containing protein n=1 Tax=Colocasia esculenta TaxID=4460 RepID=A0A843X7B7_COLES|nr:hypothetical protein [Colocasia esculenta]